jgi:hypothetical protein
MQHGESQAERGRRGNAQHAPSGAALTHQDASGAVVNAQRWQDEAFRTPQAFSAARSREKQSYWAADDRRTQHGQPRLDTSARPAALEVASRQGLEGSMIGRDSVTGRQLLATGAPPFTVTPEQSGVRIASPELRINTAPTQLFQINFGNATAELNPINLFTITGAVEYVPVGISAVISVCSALLCKW